jgi:intron-binding protein aquarius
MKRYPANKITILTTYNGQKDLINDIIQQRCARNPLFGRPVVDTVDRYQGRQNDYVMLSLVRTKNVGHLRDVRRLVVAMSRGRLGVYVFGSGVFGECRELKEVFGVMQEREERGKGKGSEVVIGGVEEMGALVVEETRLKVEWVREQKASGNEVRF